MLISNLLGLLFSFCIDFWRNQLCYYTKDLFLFFLSNQADEHESRTLDDIKEKEPEYFNRVTSVLKRAELDFGL